MNSGKMNIIQFLLYYNEWIKIKEYNITIIKIPILAIAYMICAIITSIGGNIQTGVITRSALRAT
jgi:hypothetical protein